MSRSHYAVFHAIKALLIGYRQQEGERQVSYRQLFSKVARMAKAYSWERNVPLPLSERTLLTALEWLHKNREYADYEVGLLSDRVARQAMTFSRELIRILKEQLGGHQS
ncbi:MAG: HEPN domain-containing protein [Dehalococcoidia bacterium]|nr:HEPN domain-containing protein [Dehalococcoidia bacterium]